MNVAYNGLMGCRIDHGCIIGVLQDIWAEDLEADGLIRHVFIMSNNSVSLRLNLLPDSHREYGTGAHRRRGMPI